MKIDISNDQLVTIYRNGGCDARKAIKEALGEEFSTVIPISERVKTLDDAIKEIGDDHPAAAALRAVKYSYSHAMSEDDPETADIVAYAKLRVITEALNEGWKPQFIEGERRWYGWYDLLATEDVEALTEEEKAERRVVGRSVDSAVAYGGLVCASASSASSYADSNSGSRLAFKSEELAEYAAKQFGEIYADFCFIPKAACKND